MKIKRRWIAAVLIFCACCWAFVTRLIAAKLANPDNTIIVITVIVLVFLITIYLFAKDAKKSVELKDDNQAH